MKKILLSLGAAFLLAAGANAQVSYGVKAGVNLSQLSGTHEAYVEGGESVELDRKFNPSFYVTGFADVPVAPNFSIQPGISLQAKGTKGSYNESFSEGGETANVSLDAFINTMSIEIPVNAVYYIPTGASGSVFVGAGPYIGYNISGKGKLKGSVSYSGEGTDFSEDFNESEKLKFSGDDKDMNAFDAGVNFLGGYKLSNGLIINAGYGLGLSNLIPNAQGDEKSSNRVLSFGVGFQF